MNEYSYELDFLRREVAAKLGGPVRASKDFETLSERLEEATGQQVSTSTLKRIWGYMSLKPVPRQTTLNILSRFIGREDFRALCKELQETSAFLSAETVRSSELSPGCLLEIGWMPDRRVKLRHLDGLRFTIEDPGTSKLREGDEFEVMEFVKGHPLYISGICRDGEVLPEYVAGRTAGLTVIEVH